MANLKIQIGATDGFRYIGIQPPVDDETEKEIREEIESNLIGGTLLTGCGVKVPDQGDPFTEFGLMTSGDGYDENVLRLAGNVLALLVSRKGTMYIWLAVYKISDMVMSFLTAEQTCSAKRSFSC